MAKLLTGQATGSEAQEIKENVTHPSRNPG